MSYTKHIIDLVEVWGLGTHAVLVEYVVITMKEEIKEMSRD